MTEHVASWEQIPNARGGEVTVQVAAEGTMEISVTRAEITEESSMFGNADPRTVVRGQREATAESPDLLEPDVDVRSEFERDELGASRRRSAS